MNLITIMTFLGGSGAGWFITTLIELYNKKVDFKREIFKTTHTKKLQAAETAIAFYITMLAKYTQIKIAYQTLQHCITDMDSGENDPALVQPTLEKAVIDMADLIKDKYFEANTAHLYYDLLNSAIWKEEDLLNLSLLQTKLISVNKELKEWHSNQGEKAIGHPYSKELMLKYNDKLKPLIESYDQITTAIRGHVSNMKEVLNTPIP